MSTSLIDPEYEYHEFYLDSKDASVSTDPSISPFNLPVFQLTTPLKDVASFKVLEAQIPLSYCITKGITFTINYYDIIPLTVGPAGSKIWNGVVPPIKASKVVTLPTKGAPTGAQICTTINAGLNIFNGNDPTSLGVTGWTHTPTNTFVESDFTSSASSGNGFPFITFATTAENNQVTDTSRQDFSITIDSQGARDILGLPFGTTYCNGFGVYDYAGAGGKYIRSDAPTLITGAPYVYVTSNAIGNLCKTYLPLGATLLGGGVSSPQLAKIPVSNVVQGQWLVWQDSNPAWFDVDNIATLSQFDMFVQLGNYGGYIDFQGLSFSLKLGVLVKRSTKISNNGRGTFVQSTPFFTSQR